MEYDYIGGVTKDNVLELIDFVKGLKSDVESWLKQNHPELILKSND